MKTKNNITPSLIFILVVLALIAGIVYFRSDIRFNGISEISPTSSPMITPSSAKDLEVSKSLCYSDPRQALDDYLNYLEQQDFINAGRLNEGSYLLSLAGTDPKSISAEDKDKLFAKLLGDLCAGYDTCLPHKIIEENKISTDEYWYEVVFYIQNEPYEFCGPYEGGESEPTPICHTKIKYRVKRIDGCYKNLDTPPITP